MYLTGLPTFSWAHVTRKRFDRFWPLKHSRIAFWTDYDICLLLHLLLCVGQESQIISNNFNSIRFENPRRLDHHCGDDLVSIYESFALIRMVFSIIILTVNDAFLISAVVVRQRHQ